MRTHARGLLTLLLVGLPSCGESESPTDTNDLPTPVARTLTLSPTSVSFSVLGETEQLTASVLDQNGAVMGGASVSWSSSSTSVASVSSTGLVTALADGAANHYGDFWLRHRNRDGHYPASRGFPHAVA